LITAEPPRAAPHARYVLKFRPPDRRLEVERSFQIFFAPAKIAVQGKIAVKGKLPVSGQNSGFTAKQHGSQSHQMGHFLTFYWQNDEHF
jgi:hypothetical protein